MRRKAPCARTASSSRSAVVRERLPALAAHEPRRRLGLEVAADTLQDRDDARRRSAARRARGSRAAAGGGACSYRSPGRPGPEPRRRARGPGPSRPYPPRAGSTCGSHHSSRPPGKPGTQYQFAPSTRSPQIWRQRRCASCSDPDSRIGASCRGSRCGPGPPADTKRDGGGSSGARAVRSRLGSRRNADRPDCHREAGPLTRRRASGKRRPQCFTRRRDPRSNRTPGQAPRSQYGSRRPSEAPLTRRQPGIWVKARASTGAGA